MDAEFLMRFRSLLIQLLNLIDDALGLARTIPPKSVRRANRRK